MFTGIIEEIGTIQAIQRQGEFFSLKVHGAVVLRDTKAGDSIAVNGVCLTVTSIDSHVFFCDAMAETLAKTTLRDAKIGAKVNLERALTLQTRIGGHLVSGHVDEVASIIKRESLHSSIVFRFKVTRDLLQYIAAKGSVTIDGISLTVITVMDDYFTVSIIPHTIENTTLHSKISGDTVNIEVDMLSRYVVNYIKKTSGTSAVNWEQIAKAGI